MISFIDLICHMNSGSIIRNRLIDDIYCMKVVPPIFPSPPMGYTVLFTALLVSHPTTTFRLACGVGFLMLTDLSSIEIEFERILCYSCPTRLTD